MNHNLLILLTVIICFLHYSVLTLLTLYFKLKTENANLRSGVQTKIQLKSALRSTLADKSMRSSISERSFIVRRGIFELLPVLSVSLYPF